MPVKISHGDFVVARSRWNSAEAVQVIKVSAQLVFYEDDNWGARIRRIRIADILFSGSKETAEKLAEQLNLSSALFDDEQLEAVVRKEKRDVNYITAAQSKAEAA